ncbi:hypothetical protein YPPY05_1380, partial [Yersinia pestis PY-05]
MASSLL